MKGILEMKISKEKRQFLKKELKEYEKICYHRAFLANKIIGLN